MHAFERLYEMKTKFSLTLLLSSLALVACGQGQSGQAYSLDLKVASPTGAPAAALYPFLNESEDKLEINATASNVVAYLAPNSIKDIVIAPTNAGISAINKKNAPFKLASTITFGNFYLASTGNDDNDTLDADDYVVAFQQGNVPDKIFQYVYGDMNFSNLHYVDEASNAAACLISKKNISDNNADVDYVLVAEPAFTPAMSKNKDAKQYASISEEYAKKSGNKPIMQASVFVNDNADKTKVNRFLTELEKGINGFVADPSVIDPYVEKLGEDAVKSKLGVPSTAVLKAVTKNGNRMGLGYKNAYQNKDAIDNFLSLFSLSANEEVYFK